MEGTILHVTRDYLDICIYINIICFSAIVWTLNDP